jgi:hypothetical protein
MNKLLFYAPLLLATSGLRAEMVVTPWQPLFQGIQHARGTNYPDDTIPRLQVANCLRIDLSNPDVMLFPTPPASNHITGQVETYTLSVSNFLKIHGLAVATACNFYNASPGGSDPQAEGLSCQVFGLQVCTGAVVSLPENGPDFNGRHASLLFTTNKQAMTAFDNRPPGVDLTGIYTAVTGYYPILSNNVNIGDAAVINYPDPAVHGPEPRTLFGLSADRRYFFMTTVDGRQPGYSEGSTDFESAMWMAQFGAADAVNMDGGGSASMYLGDCAGNPVPLNHSSYVPLRGRERITGSQMGVYAKPLPSTLAKLTVVPGPTTALIQWATDAPATSQVEYGPTPSYGFSTTLDSRLKRNHVATLAGLAPETTYYFKAFSVAEGITLSDGCSFTTTKAPAVDTLLFDVEASWKYTTNNLDGVNWRRLDYDDSDWEGPHPGLFHIENNTLVFPRNTLLPPGVNPPMRTYYFRKHFEATGSKTGLSLTLSNYVDDGAVFYLNDTELQRLRMPPEPFQILNSTPAINSPCAGTVGAGDATCPEMFTASGNLLKGLVQGDNVIAVELHNLSSSSDVVFGCALYATRASLVPPELGLILEGSQATLFWNDEGYTLQKSSSLEAEGNWADLPGPTTSPVTVTNSGTTFYRLRQ